MANPQLDALARELDHRREKQWRIFSWIAAILVASIGGTLALKLRVDPKDFAYPFKVAITVAAGSLQMYAWIWIRQNWQLELKALRKLHDLGVDLPTNDQKASYLGERDSGLVFGYIQALFLVFVALVAVVWIAPAGV
jgi:hypothetical protein